MSNSDESRQQEFSRIVSQCIRDSARGKEVDYEQLCAQHPDIADDLRKYFRVKSSQQKQEDLGEDGAPLEAYAIDSPDEISSGKEAPFEGAARTPVVQDQDQSNSAEITLGRYRILALLDESDTVACYRARDATLNREVTLTMLKRSSAVNVRMVEQFKLQAKAVEQIEHRNLERLLDIGESDGTYYVASEAVAGQPLADWMQSREERSALVIGNVVRKLAVAIQHAHSKKVCIGRLASSRIVVDDKQQPLIVFFGTGFAAESRGDRWWKDQDGDSYKSNAPLDDATRNSIDIRSLGIVTATLLTGKTICDDLSVAVRQFTPRKSSQLLIGCESDDRLVAICRKMLDDSPEKSFHSIDELINALSQYLKDGLAEKRTGRRAQSENEAAGIQQSDDSDLEFESELLSHRQQKELGKRRENAEQQRRQIYLALMACCLLIAVATGIYYGVQGIRDNPVETVKSAPESPPKVVPHSKGAEPAVPPQAEPEQPSPPPLAVAPFDEEQAKTHQKAWAEFLGVPVEREVDLGDGVKLTMVLIPPGEFMMGSSKEEQLRFLGNRTSGYIFDEIRSEGPKHQTRLTKPIWLSRHEVTRAQFRQFVESTGYKTDAERHGEGGTSFLANSSRSRNPRYTWSAELGLPQTDDHPVVNVTWGDATAFCQWLSKKQDTTYHLPSEAQWEYACRAGTTTIWNCGDNEASLRKCAWFSVNSARRTHPVGQLLPNAFGLFDMNGNVWEWCADWYAAEYYGKSPSNDPGGPAVGTARIHRGSGWSYPSPYLRPARRARNSPDVCFSNLGFRLAAVVNIAPYNTAPVAAYAVDVAAAQAASESKPDDSEAAQRLLFALKVQPEIVAGLSAAKVAETREKFISSLSQYVSMHSIKELGWKLTRTVDCPNGVAAHYNPRDGLLYVLRRKSADTAGHGLYRIEADDSLTIITDSLTSSPSAVVVDAKDGDVFFTEMGSGNVFRVPFGTKQQMRWVSGFHAGDDDTAGMAIAPENYTGSVVEPGNALAIDFGWRGPKEIWRFSPNMAEGETVVHRHNGKLKTPVDITIGMESIYFVDSAGLRNRNVYKLEVGGSLKPLKTSRPISFPVAIATDPTTQDLLIIDGGVGLRRVNPATGVVTDMFTGLSTCGTIVDELVCYAGLDVSPDGSQIFITDTEAGVVFTFTREGTVKQPPVAPPRFENPESSVLPMFKAHTAEVGHLRFSKDASRLLSTSCDHSVRLWDVNNKQQSMVLTGHTSCVQSACFSPDEELIAGSGMDKTVRIWDAADGTLLHTMRGHTQWSWDVEFSPDGKTLASCGADGTIRLWNPETGQHLRTLTGHPGVLFDISFSPDGKLLVSAGADRTVRLWDLDAEKPIRTFRGHTDKVESVAFLPDGKRIVTGSWDKTVRLWDVSTGLELKRFGGHTAIVRTVAVSTDGTRIVSGSTDKSCRIWDVESGQVVAVFRTERQCASTVVFHPDGQHVAFASGVYPLDIAGRKWKRVEDYRIRLWEFVEGTETVEGRGTMRLSER